MTQIDQTPEQTPVPAAKQLRPRSGTACPYYDLDGSIGLASAVVSKGGGQCSQDQLASFLGHSTTNSGAFLTRLAAAKMFGLVNIDKDIVTLTERAGKILSPVFPEEAAEGKVEAFLAVPLFSQVYEQFKGRTLPPEVGLKNAFATQYKIVQNRLAGAYRVLMESADQAGFFATSGDRSRLIRPLIQTGKPDSELGKHSTKQDDGQDKNDSTRKPFGGGGDGPTVIHPAIVGLLRELPNPGNPWPRAKKETFKTAFGIILDVVYPTEEGDESNQ